MKKVGLAVALAIAVLASTVSLKPAKADGGTTAAAIIAGVVTVASLKCTDAAKDEYLCIFAPFNSSFCGIISCPKDQNGKVITPSSAPTGKTSQILQKSNFVERAAVRFVRMQRPDLKFPKIREAKASDKQEKTQIASQNTQVH